MNSFANKPGMHGGNLPGEARRFIRSETLKTIPQGSIPPAIVMWFAFTDFPMPMWGSEGFAAFHFKNSFGMAFIMTSLMTLGVRAAIRKGKAPVLAWTRNDHFLLRLVPRNVLLRALVFGMCNAAVVGSLSNLAAMALGIVTIGHLPFVLFMAGQCAVTSTCLPPLILVGAMTDQ